MVIAGLLFVIALLGVAISYLVYRVLLLQQDVADKARHVDQTSKTLIQKHIELLDSNERLQKLVQSKTDFVSIASHQLRSPLTDVKWGLSYFLDNKQNKLAAVDREHLRDILTNVDRMNHLINELLDFVASEGGTSRSKKERVNLEHIIRTVTTEAVEHFRNKSVSVRSTFQFGPEVVLVDVGLIELAFANLINNAFQYTPNGKGIHIKTERRGSKFYFEVRDEGVGIPQDKQANVFSKFKRSQSAIKMNSMGIGLGLHITKNIIDGMDGQIGFISAGEGEGTTFYFYIPVEEEAEKEDTTA